MRWGQQGPSHGFIEALIAILFYFQSADHSTRKARPLVESALVGEDARNAFSVEITAPPLYVARNPDNQRKPWCYVQVGFKQLVQECMVNDCSFGECH